ncbi:hypothetical protein [Vibrio parahaemolyticus]|uniref:hypothetical protein n=1 Tax=Vibrio parahaemolyticus TaxID=670 RepID=UPI00084A5438|nr:hypothetical protein [Vibrio parahaemolyticus]EJE8518659.1 hypothetical protein [Vibrio parahaemolyticus]ODZ75713.1 hypothetical protein BBM46_10475 [Vibrio parahaemolyticus]OEA12887.1 hypothetical protein BBM54_09215 [Vibrio parahaemolyticus]HCH5747666.1 hypothetical protein [Vibrio parahaemolyticus]
MTPSSSQPNKQVFKLSYDMKETAEHTIDAEMLGHAILSMTSTMKTANKLLNGDNSDLQVQVRAHQEGSFMVEFVTWLNNGGADVLQILGITTAASVAGTKTVLGAMEELKGRKIVGSVQRDGKVILKTKDGSDHELEPDVAKILLDKDVRKSIETVFKAPIEDKDDAKLIIKNADDEELKVVKSEDAISFKRLPQKTLESVSEETKQMTIYFSQVNFDALTGWKCKLPNGDIESVKMNHEAFIERINKGYEKFSKTEPYIVRMKTVKTTKPDNTVNTRYTLEEVIRQQSKKN